MAKKKNKPFLPEKFLLMKFYFSKGIPEMEKHTLKKMFMYSTGETIGLQGDVVYLSWPRASLVRAQMREGGGGGFEVSANENSCVHCAHHVTWSPNKLWTSNSTFNHIWEKRIALVLDWMKEILLFLLSYNPTFRYIFQQISRRFLPFVFFFGQE